MGQRIGLIVILITVTGGWVLGQEAKTHKQVKILCPRSKVWAI